MGPGQRLLTALVGSALATSVLGQTTAPATIEEADWELPAEVRAEFAHTQDFAFNFDQPGFYGVVAFVKQSARSPGYLQTPIEVQDWRDLLERPSDFRGRPVTIEGLVGRNRDPYTLPNHPELGSLWQLDLRRPDQPITCTLILTGSAADIPLNASLSVTGYFVLIRSYYDASNRARQAALLVAPGPTTIGRVMPHTPASGVPDWRWIIVAAVVGLLVTVILLRRSVAARRRDYHTLLARHEAPVSLADDLAAWASDEPGATPADSAERSRRDNDDY
jgi:hypothetical protein